MFNVVHVPMGANLEGFVHKLMSLLSSGEVLVHIFVRIVNEVSVLLEVVLLAFKELV
jgi:hypothetical protein